MLVEGSFVVAAARELVWRQINDPAVVGPCIPGCTAVEVVDPTHYKAQVKVELGPIKANFNLEVEVTEQTALERVLSVTRGEEGGRASMVTARNSLVLLDGDPGRTEVRYTSEVSVTGRLGKFGLGLMRKRAEVLGAQFAERFRIAVEGAAGQA